jgi:hypothetical protein
MSEIPLYVQVDGVDSRYTSVYRGTSPIRKRPFPQEPLRTLGIGIR